jgi:hypothetical protein
MPNRSIATAIHGLAASRPEILVSQGPRPSAASAPAGRPEASAASRDEAPRLGRYIAVAAAASASIVLVVVTVGLMAASTSFVASLGIGAFAAAWGGGGFGAMIGGVLYVHRFEEPGLTPSLVGTELDRSPALLPPWPSEAPVPGRR